MASGESQEFLMYSKFLTSDLEFMGHVSNV